MGSSSKVFVTKDQEETRFQQMTHLVSSTITPLKSRSHSTSAVVFATVIVSATNWVPFDFNEAFHATWRLVSKEAIADGDADT